MACHTSVGECKESEGECKGNARGIQGEFSNGVQIILTSLLISVCKHGLIGISGLQFDIRAAFTGNFIFKV